MLIKEGQNLSQEFTNTEALLTTTPGIYVILEVEKTHRSEQHQGDVWESLSQE